MHRHLWLAPVAAAAAIASPALAQQTSLSLELKKVFPYLEAYQGLPAAERSKFRMAYFMFLNPKAPLQVAYVDGARRTPIALGPEGRVMALPTPEMFRTKVKVELSAPKGSKLSQQLALEPVLRPAAELDARELAAAVRQASVGSKKAAGMLGFAVPKFERVVFKGAAGGQVVDAAGKVAPLPVVKGDPVFDPQVYPQARTRAFFQAATAVDPRAGQIGPIGRLDLAGIAGHKPRLR